MLLLVLVSIAIAGFVISNIKNGIASEAEAQPAGTGGNILYVGSGANNYTKIQDAIDNANDGDTIFVYSGTYYENVVVNKRVTIIGNGSANCIVQAANSNNHIFNVTANWVNISGFTVENATGDNKAGIYLYGVKHCNISNNNISNNKRGIYLDSSSNNILTNNTMSNNQYNFGIWGMGLSQFTQNIDTSNTVNGKPIQYLMNKKDLVIDSSWDVGYLGIVNCTNITIKDLTLTNNDQGVLFAYSSNSRIENIDALNNRGGISLLHSSNNNIITNNNISGNHAGIGLFGSSNNTIMNNIASNVHEGIGLAYSSSNNITNNTINVSVPLTWHRSGFSVLLTIL